MPTKREKLLYMLGLVARDLREATDKEVDEPGTQNTAMLIAWLLELQQKLDKEDGPPEN
jgi:hypothetical protein